MIACKIRKNLIIAAYQRNQNLPVDSIGMVLIQILYSLLQFRTSLTFLNGHDEQLDVSIQGELIHRVNTTHIIQDKEQDGGSLSRRSVALYS